MIIIDTNALIYSIKHKVPLDKGEELIVMSPCVKELTSLKTREAKLALELLRKGDFKIIDSDRPADAAIVDFASRNKAKVLTNDRELIKTLKKKNIRVFTLRQKKYFGEV